MSRVNGQVDVDRRNRAWELLVRSSVDYAAEVQWIRGHSACTKL